MRRYVRPVACGFTVAWGWTVALALTFAFTAPARAQTDVLNELYGSGVHAFNSGQYRDAYNDLTMAIRSGSRDPRVYYYRGLAYLRLGRPHEAQGDFRKGASLEMADTDRFYPVSKSLERIQGQARAQIERYRSSARLVAYQTRERQRYERYERIRKNEPNVLMTPDEATEMPSPAKEPATEPAEEPDEEMPAEKPEPDEADAFADKDDKEPAEEMPAEKSADEADPFAEDGDKEMPAEKADEGDDPFADDADAKKPAEEGDAEMPADEASDDKADDEKPAGEKKPADKKTDDDPFAK